MRAWKTVPLGEVSNFVRGINFKPEDVVPLGTPGSVGCLRTSNVQSEVDLADVWGVSESFVRRPEQMLRAGDILISSANSWNLVGKCSWIPELPWRASFGGFVSVLRADTARVEPRFLYRWFSSTRIQTTLRSFGRQTTNISNLNIERCLGLGLPLPSLPEQRRIAAILEKAGDLRAKRRAALATLDELAQSVFVEMFADPSTNPRRWAPRKVGSLLESATYGTSAKAGTTGAYPILRMGNITSTGGIDLSDMKFIDMSEVDASRYLVRAGDVLFNRTNSPDLVGKSAIYRLAKPMVFAGYLIRLRTNADNDPEFLAAFLNTGYAKRTLRNMCKTIIGMANINATEIQAMGAFSPPLNLQRSFGKRIRLIETHRASYERSLATLDALCSSLQHRAFRGEL